MTTNQRSNQDNLRDYIFNIFLNGVGLQEIEIIMHTIYALHEGLHIHNQAFQHLKLNIYKCI